MRRRCSVKTPATPSTLPLSTADIHLFFSTMKSTFVCYLRSNLGLLASTTSLPLLAIRLAPRFRVTTFETPCTFFKAWPQTLPNDALRGPTNNEPAAHSDKTKQTRPGSKHAASGMASLSLAILQHSS